MKRFNGKIDTLSLAFAVVMLCFTTGCTSTVDARAQRDDGPYITAGDYTCGDGTAVHIKWWSDRVEVSRGQQTWNLPHAISGSGARYSDGVREVWEHQDEVRVSDGQTLPLTCRKIEK